ncbi:MAG: outer membrane lipoprotein carrier protein LolA [Deltaproteobacteria bacterium]|nr:outer membrane lipoprotein carrier protein LolA [Deltaproteobacteria bacterium]
MHFFESTFLVFMALCTFHAPAAAKRVSMPAAKILDLVRTFYNKADQLKVSFVQIAKSKFEPGAGERATGTLYVKRPNRFRWEYDDPSSGSLLVWDGKDLYQYDAIDNTVEIVHGFTSNNLTTALSFLFGKGDLKSEFEVKSESTNKNGEEIELKLLPRKKPSRFKELYLVINSKSGEVLKTWWKDSYGGYNSLVFKDLVIGGHLGRDVFRFHIPKAAEVMESQGNPGKRSK